MTDYNNGQIHGWNGGDCPVHPETVVRYWLRSGASHEVKARTPCWSHTLSGSDIIAFQVVKAYVEPKVIWVNEYPKCYRSFNTPEDAKKYVDHAEVTRIAVKYVEVVDDKEAKDD